MQPTRQYKRRIQTIVGKKGNGLLIQDLRMVIEVCKDHQSAPNSAIIKIFNLNDQHQAQIRTEFDDVIVNAGYEGSEAVLFRGNVRHVYRYREGNDFVVEIDAGDGDRDFRGAIVNTTLAAGVPDGELIKRVAGNMSSTKMGAIKGIRPTTRLRGKVITGNARTVLDDVARNSNASWSIQDGRLQIVPVNGVLDSEAILVNADTGMLGAPEQDDKGLKVKTLLNPQYQINGRIKLDNNSIKRKKAKAGADDLRVAKGKERKEPARLDPDGVYKIYKVVHKGDNRDGEWVSEVYCVAMDSAFPKSESKNERNRD